jgi:outer membrane lipoprotein-sorting protein
MDLRATRAIAITIFVSTVGCGGAPRPTYPYQVAERALERHTAQQAQVTSLRAEARVDQRGRDGRIRGTVLMFVERPDRVRFDAMTQFGPAAVLTSDGERFELFDMRENRFLVGPTCPENIARLLGLTLPAESVVRFLLGESPRVAATSSSIEVIRGGYKITLQSEDGSTEILELRVPARDAEAQPEAQELRLARAEVRDPSGRVAWRAEYEDYRDVALPGGGEVPMPFVLRFEDPRSHRDVLVRFKKIEPNVDVPETAFEQPIPGGVTPEPVECQ